RLEKKFGRYPPNAIYKNTKEVLGRNYPKRCPESYNGKLILHTDFMRAYRRVIKYALHGAKIVHLKTSSKDYRNYKNNLFAVNHTDMLTRHHLAAFKRETIAFSKTPMAMIETYALFMIW